MSDSVITFRVSKHNPDLVSKIKVLAHQDGRTLNNYVEKILLQHANKEIKPSVPADVKPDIIEELLEEFKKKYEKIYKKPYIQVKKGIDRSSINKILTIFKKQNPTETRDNTIYWFSVFFEKCLTINDQWLRNNMSPAIMLSQYNRIMKILDRRNPQVRQLISYDYPDLCDLVSRTNNMMSDYKIVKKGVHIGKWVKISEAQSLGMMDIFK